MNIQSIHFWGDSIFKGIVFDEVRGRYVILKNNAARLIGSKFNLPTLNNCLMGRTAPQGLEAMREEKESLENVLTIIEYGGNDCDFDWAAVAQSPEETHLPNTTLDRFGDSLKTTAELVRKRGGLPVLCTLPPLDAQRYFEWISRGLSKEGILKYLGEVQAIFHWQKSYSDKARQIAKEAGCFCLPLREAFLNPDDGEDLMCIDGIHPSFAGHAALAAKAIEELMNLHIGLQS